MTHRKLRNIVNSLMRGLVAIRDTRGRDALIRAFNKYDLARKSLPLHRETLLTEIKNARARLEKGIEELTKSDAAPSMAAGISPSTKNTAPPAGLETKQEAEEAL